MSFKIKHPAKYTDSFIPLFAEILIEKECKKVLDPFAGICKIAEIKKHGYEGLIYANEIEKEWAFQGFGEVDCLNVGDAECLPFKDDFFDAICTSPTYGNRMADSHKARDSSKRNTYTHTLGRELKDGNTGKMQWGSRYREKHEAVYLELKRVLKDDGIFILNISDHIRKGKVVKVTEWHVRTLEDLGFEKTEEKQIETPRNGFGANSKLRVPYESIILFTLRKEE